MLVSAVAVAAAAVRPLLVHTGKPVAVPVGICYLHVSMCKGTVNIKPTVQYTINDARPTGWAWRGLLEGPQ